MQGVGFDNDAARVLLVDANVRVIASSDGIGILPERLPLNTGKRSRGYYQDKSGALIAFHVTPGSETYKGLGWYGVIVRVAPLHGTAFRRTKRPAPWALPRSETCGAAALWRV